MTYPTPILHLFSTCRHKFSVRSLFLNLWASIFLYIPIILSHLLILSSHQSSLLPSPKKIITQQNYVQFPWINFGVIQILEIKVKNFTNIFKIMILKSRFFIWRQKTNDVYEYLSLIIDLQRWLRGVRRSLISISSYSAKVWNFLSILSSSSIAYT